PGGAPRPQAPPAGRGTFLALTHRGPAGTRDYKLFVPPGSGDSLLPLIVMLHGCTQDPDDFAAGTGMNKLAEEAGCLVAYPRQPASANPSKCWNWFNDENQHRDQGEAALLAELTRAIISERRVDPARVYVAGLSAGGAAAAILAVTYPDLFAAVGVHSGLACGAARDMASAFTAMRQGGASVHPAPSAIPAIVFHGDRDCTVHPGNGDSLVSQFTADRSGLRETSQTGRAPGGHGYRRTLHSAADGTVLCEQWTIQGGGHAWSGGQPAGSFTDPRGPDASAEMLRFFLAQCHPGLGARDPS
ncbi:esterase, partial [Rhodospirillum rubrum]|uniref:extracellular catalytic domain type 1 short-chain-length polyhydroxyalkanoate depolymerase n=2 Tax=Rhodospirillum rubrum TaxID=1085 RepID=UPI0019072B62